MRQGEREQDAGLVARFENRVHVRDRPRRKVVVAGDDEIVAFAFQTAAQLKRRRLAGDACRRVHRTIVERAQMNRNAVQQKVAPDDPHIAKAKLERQGGIEHLVATREFQSADVAVAGRMYVPPLRVRPVGREDDPPVCVGRQIVARELAHGHAAHVRDFSDEAHGGNGRPAR